MTDAPRASEFEYEVPQRLIDYYAENGAVRLPRPFDSWWIDGLLDGYEEIMRNWEAGSTDYPVVRRNGNLGIQNVVMRHPFYRKWAIESPVAEIVGQVTRSDSIRFYFDNFFCKEGTEKEAATPLHHDVAAFGFKGTQLPSFWIALTDVDRDNAPLITALGSHRNTGFMFRSPAQKAGLPLLEGYREPMEIPGYLEKNGYELKTWPVEKGDVIMVNPYTIHASHHRRGGAGIRIAHSSRWLGDDVTWQGSIYNEMEASTHEPKLESGSPPSEQQFPVIWKRGEGNLARRSGRFTTHITLEQKKGYYDTVDASYKAKSRFVEDLKQA